MPAPDDPPVRLVRVERRGSRAGAWVATAAVLLTLAALVGAAVLGNDRREAPRPLPSRAAGLSSPADASPSPAGAAAPDPTPSPIGPRIIAATDAGYEVEYPRDSAHRPVIFDGGALAIFGYGERVPDGTYPGTVRVAVGTPARGAPVPGVDGQTLLHADSLDELLIAVLAAEREVPSARSTFAIDGEPALLLDFPVPTGGGPPRSVALAVRGGRSYVITAVGFEQLLPGFRYPANAGLVRFLAGLQFTTPLYVNRQLGFQVPQPLDVPTTGEGPGAVVFAAGAPEPGGTWSHSISVAVGTEDEPAIVQVLPGAGAARTAQIWASSLVGLQAAYVDAVWGRVGSSSTIRVGGELALLIDRPNGLALTALVVRQGRVYILSAAGPFGDPRPGRAFERFLAQFRFLDRD